MSEPPSNIRMLTPYIGHEHRLYIFDERLTYAYPQMKPTIIGAVVYSERKFPTLFPEDHNNSQCFVFTKMSGSGSCRIHLQRYEETGKKQKEMGFIFIFIADKQD